MEVLVIKYVGAVFFSILLLAVLHNYSEQGVLSSDLPLAFLSPTGVIEHWQKGDHHIICLPDLHTYAVDSNRKRAVLVQTAKKLHGVIIVEDHMIDFGNVHSSGVYAEIKNDPLSFDANDDFTDLLSENFFAGKDRRTNSISLVLFLSSLCKKESVPVENVEFRQLWDLSLKGLSISAADAWHSIQQAIAELAQYDDGAVLNHYYKALHAHYTSYEQKNKKLFSHIAQQKTPLQTKANSFVSIALNNQYETYYSENVDDALTDRLAHKSIVDYLLRSSTCSDDDLLEAAADEIEDMSIAKKIYSLLSNYPDQLIDARILHQIYRHKDKPYIFICAGALHISCITALLVELGYKKVEAEGCFKTACNKAISCAKGGVDDLFTVSSAEPCLIVDYCERLANDAEVSVV